MSRILITASRCLGREIGFRKDALLFVHEYRSVAGISIGVLLLLIAANIENPPWWLAVMGWIPIAVYLANWVFSLPESDPRQAGILISALSFFLLGGFGMSSLIAFFRALLQPSIDNLILFGISRGFLASTTIYFAVACLGYRSLLEAKEAELYRCRSTLEKTLVNDHERPRSLTAEEIGKARVREAERRLKEYKRRVTRGRYLRKLREQANSTNGH